jgi:WhiB family transcriptional regulator, redox-sensing transcriptional regulator
MTALTLPPEWMRSALCTQVDPDLWFPEKGGHDMSRQPKRICRECPVIAECLSYALEHEEMFGVWGGTGERERRKILRRRRGAA